MRVIIAIVAVPIVITSWIAYFLIANIDGWIINYQQW